MLYSLALYQGLVGLVIFWGTISVALILFFTYMIWTKYRNRERGERVSEWEDRLETIIFALVGLLAVFISLRQMVNSMD